MKTRLLFLLATVVALVLAHFTDVSPAYALPLLFGTILSDENTVKLDIANGLRDSNGVSHEPRRDRVETLTAARTLTILDSGKTFLVGAADLVVTLPAASSATLGMKARFIITTAGLATVTGFSLSPNSADFITATGKTAVDNKDLINTAATDDDGDAVEIFCDGVDGWVAIVTGTWAKEA